MSILTKKKKTQTYLSKHELKICSKSSQNLSKIMQKLITNCVFGGFGGHVAPRSRFFRFFIDFYLSLDRSLGWWKWPIPIACYTIAHFGLFEVLKNKLNIKPSWDPLFVNFWTISGPNLGFKVRPNMHLIIKQPESIRTYYLQYGIRFGTAKTLQNPPKIGAKRSQDAQLGKVACPSTPGRPPPRLSRHFWAPT